ncbi:hypothetical protein TrLO_g7653 [Triparma laevis f. longispina]|uniref:CAP-Gly domain-containing protein n=1 Tax=Triparma laevis f. longispina TaxID=1714387 RepID=A0A9W7C955_9STRA|nr:hypothetical protein TrLO_g7653 [Triparma laevis f. longispina]
MSTFTITPTIGTRISDSDGFLGTVLYIGPVSSAKNQKETYCGIEWDDSTRGKHDGSVISREDKSIVRHFRCESGSLTAGSFVKSSKLNFGVDFCQTLSERYVQLDAPLLAPDNKFRGCVAMTKGGRSKQIEFHGEEKIRKYQQVEGIEKVALRGAGVSHAGDDTEKIAEYAGHLTEVDLQGNMLHDWEEVGKIINQLSALEMLHLNANRLGNPEPLPETFKNAIGGGGYRNLKRLVLNSINMKSWGPVSGFTDVFPNLEELYLASNDLSDISTCTSSTNNKVTGFPSLRLLDVSDCSLTTWSQVKSFSNLPMLESLVMNENDIEGIEKVEGGEFKNLLGVQISGTKMKSWEGVDNLNSFKKLKNLRFGNSPITAVMGGSEARAVIIARVCSVTYLNGSPVTAKERLEAEKMYVRRVARELTMAVSMSGDENSTPNEEINEEKKKAVIARHPMFEDLAKKHAASICMAGGGSAQSSLSNDTINVTIHSMAAASCTVEPMSKRLPSSLAIGRLKQMCKRAFKLDIDLQILQFKADKDSMLQPLDDDNNSLGYFGVCDGAQIFMNEVDTKALAREAEKLAIAEKEAKERMVKQEEEANVMKKAQQMQVDKEREGVAAATKR